MKILLVEDHEEARHNLHRLLENRGHAVVSFGTAEEADGACRTQKFEFLILDWMLPGKSGLDLCRNLRAHSNGAEMFILLVTAHGDACNLQQALAAGANDYLTKPLDLGRLGIRLSVAERHIRDLGERNHARSALQESVRMMESILENTGDAFFAVDAQWCFTYLNRQGEALLGHNRADLLGASLWERFPELLGTTFEDNFRKVMTDRGAVEFEAAAANGAVWFEMHAYASEGGISVFFRDVSERKRFEQERFTMTKLESLGTLAGGIAHDLNNILTVISGNISLAQIEAPSECVNLVSFLAKANQAASHAAHLSSQLLTFSKGGAPRKQIVALSELLAHSAEFSLYGSNLRADVDIPMELWKVEIDSSQIEQAINALLINAREAMPNGGSVKLSARNVVLTEEEMPLLPAGNYVKVLVSDRGSGVSEFLAEKIFDPYVTTKPSGTGLGLSISYSVVKKHGGLLHLESSSSEGSAFAFYLPASDGELAAVEIPLAPIDRHLDQNRILLMDDEAAIRELTSQLLTTLGYEVVAVPDGMDAVRVYDRALRRGEYFQAVILDATIRGGMGGLATIERLRMIDPNVNAIICSGYSDEAALSEFLTYGFRGALAKPFTRRQLAEALQKTLAA